jgi:hypothetical protein
MEGLTLPGPLNVVVNYVEEKIISGTDGMFGLCSDSGAKKPKKYYVEDTDILNLKSGGTLESEGACVNLVDPVGGYDSRCKKLYGKKCYPDNGEFSYHSVVPGEEGNCSMCNHPDKGYGCKCDSLVISGKKVLFKRKPGSGGYKAPPLECCRQLPGTLTFNNRIYKNTLTCDPKYSSQSSDECTTDSSVTNFCLGQGVNIQQEGVCLAIVENKNYPSKVTRNRILKTYCDTSDNMFTKQTCREWITNKTNDDVTTVRNLVDKYCIIDDNIHKEPCRTFIKNAGLNQDSYYDTMMTAWCKNHPDDSRCACIMSKHNKKVAADGTAIQGLPECVDEKCTDLMRLSNGLIPSTMIKPACSYFDCKQFINSGGLIIGNNNKTFATMKMECGTPIEPGSLRTTVGEQGATGNVEIAEIATEGTEGANKEIKIKILILLMLIIVVIAGAWILLSDDSPTVGGVFMNNFNDKYTNVY